VSQAVYGTDLNLTIKIFKPAKGIVSYRQVISSHLNVRLNFKGNLFTPWPSTYTANKLNDINVKYLKIPKKHRRPHETPSQATCCPRAACNLCGKQHVWNGSTTDNKAHFLQPILPLKCTTAQTICAVKSHLVNLRHSKTKKKHENKMKLFE